jgi:hypothetical protein
MARTDLSSLLEKIDTEDVEPLQRPTESPASPETAPPVVKVDAQVSSAPETESATRLVRKETRLREEQYETLTEYARKLNRAKAPGAGERITENTLIRIAIDLLIPHLSEMSGSDEAQLRDSVTNRV